jgi:O-antigen/teichoic acid export membrane protein
MRKSLIDLAIGSFSQAILVGSGLVMLPFVVTKLPQAEIGLWYIYLTIQAIVYMLDFGITETFIRFFSYVFAGARELKHDFIPLKSGDDSMSSVLLSALLDTAHRVSLYITFLAGLVMGVFGTYYINVMAHGAKLHESIWPSWMIFSAAMLAQTYFQWQGAVLIGSGRVRLNYQIAVWSRVAQIVFTILTLLIHPSLTVMSLGFAVATIIMRYCYYLSLASIRNLTKGMVWPQEIQRDLMVALWRSARHTGGTVIGALLANRIVVLAVGWYAGLQISAQYSIANQALIALGSIATVAQTMYGPRIAKAGVDGDQESLKSMFSQSLVFGWIVCIAGGVSLITIIPFGLALIRAHTSLPPLPILFLMICTSSLEMNMFVSTRLITTAENTIPHWKATLITGGVLVASVVVGGQFGLGLPGILFVQLFTQLAYNFWRWPMYCFKYLGLKLRDVPHYAMSGFSRIS